MAEFERDGQISIEDLQDEIRLLKQNNQQILAGQSSDKQELFKKISELDQQNDDLKFEIQTLQQKLK